jgi:hypothetical protein
MTMLVAAAMLAGCGGPDDKAISPPPPAACATAQYVATTAAGLWCEWSCEVAGVYVVRTFSLQDGAWEQTSVAGGPCGQ